MHGKCELKELIHKDEAEPARLLTLGDFAMRQQNLFVQEVAMKKRLFLRCTWVQVDLLVDP